MWNIFKKNRATPKPYYTGKWHLVYYSVYTMHDSWRDAESYRVKQGGQGEVIRGDIHDMEIGVSS